MRIKNWAQFQHFKDRSPPWIKLHREFLDDYDINMEAIKFLNEAFKFCNDNKYELIWFCKDIERVYLRKKVVKDEKKKEAGKFKANKTIRNIDAKNLVASKYKDGTSNILNILDKYLERK